MTTTSAIASGAASSPRTARATAVPASSSSASWLAIPKISWPGTCMSSSRTVAPCCAARAAPAWLRAGSTRRAARKACCVRANSTVRSVSTSFASAAARSVPRPRRPAARNAATRIGTPASAASPSGHEIGSSAIAMATGSRIAPIIGVTR